MAAPRNHPIDELIRIASEATALMWRCYDAHIGTPQYDPEWQVKARLIFARCTACDERLLRLKHLRMQVLGARPKDSERQPADDVTMESGEAEWNVRRLRHLLVCHEASPRRDDNWKAQQLRIMTALRNAMIKLVDVSEQRVNIIGGGIN